MTPPAPPAPTALALMTLLPAFSQWSSFLLIHIDIIQYTGSSQGLKIREGT